MGNPKSNRDRDRPIGRGAAFNGPAITPPATPQMAGDPVAGNHNGPNLRGSIKRLIRDKGFGFIMGENGKEYFFHMSEVDDPSGFDGLIQDQQVSFTPTSSVKGPRAQAIRVIHSATAG